MPNESTKYTIEMGRKVAELVIKRLEPYCKPARCVVAGSIRRGAPMVHDVDIVLIPGDSWNLYQEILALNKPFKPSPDGPKIKKIRVGGMPVDLYITDEREWATILLIRTGSVANNIRLCTRAKDIGFQLKADGSGLFNQFNKRIAGDTEMSIYGALGLPYQNPDERR